MKKFAKTMVLLALAMVITLIPYIYGYTMAHDNSEVIYYVLVTLFILDTDFVYRLLDKYFGGEK